MSPRNYWNERTQSEIQDLCDRAETTVANFKQIALWGGSVGAALAKRLSTASGEAMSAAEILWPTDQQMLDAREHRQKYGTLRKAKSD